MKQIAQNYRSGELTVLEVPRPSVSEGGVLVRTLFSLISTGTELMKVNESKLSLVGKARSRPDQVRKVVDAALQQGVTTAYRKTMNQLDSYTPLGYSLAGVVTEVGRGAEELAVGQLVACAGNEFALHAEHNWVPVNLCVPVPEGVTPELAAFTTVGAIALQGVRQSDAQLGDLACVIGLGLVGQIVVRLLVASGVRVVGLDVVASRCRLAEQAGALRCAAPDEQGVSEIEQVLAVASGGLGADRVFLVAGGSSNGPVESAARLARDRATVVDIGKCRLDLPWNAYYDKELQLRFSRSYGPGRYDPRYELDGVDYPAGYVRWTERRNMACVLDLVASGQLDLAPLVSEVFPVTEATHVYQQLQANQLDGIGYLFSYPEPPETLAPIARARLPRPTAPAARTVQPVLGRSVGIGFIGAGNYASSMLLPHLQGRQDVVLRRVATRRSLSATNAQRKFGFTAATTEIDAVLDDPGIDGVFVVTRHSSHASMVRRALEAGKAVFVEKPLCLDHAQLEAILETVARTGNDRLMVGFNRRFAPLLTSLRSWFGDPRQPGTVRYLVNAGSLAPTSWYAQEDQEGSRFVGEGGHFVDTASWWFGSDPVEVRALPGSNPGNVAATLYYADGSLAHIDYLTDGHPRFPKESFDAASAGRSARLDNFTRATAWSGRRSRTRRSLGGADKGQRQAIEAFVGALRSGGPMPIPLTSLAATTRATLAVATSLAGGQGERI